MKIFIVLLALTAFLNSCSDGSLSGVSGQWKLHTIEMPDGAISNVDTIFYSFQKDTFFMFTVLINSDNSTLSNGSFRFISDSKLQIIMDTIGNNNEPKTYPEFLNYSGWKGYHEDFDIVYIRNKEMKLIDSERRTYILKKH